MKTKFKRIYRELKGSADAKGRIQVRIILLSEDQGRRFGPQKGNITRQVLLEDAKVSEVYDAIDAAICTGRE